MKLLEAILEANHRAVAGDPHAGIHPEDYDDELPLVALTCIDPRLNPLFPNVLGIPADKFIWLRNAGNVISGPTSSTTRSLALSCAVKNGKELAIIGHTDCLISRTTTMHLLEQFQKLGIERHMLPENINEYFHLFASIRQNVINACAIVRGSPLIGPHVMVHGLIVDVVTGKLEWVVNGYQDIPPAPNQWNNVATSAGPATNALNSLSNFEIGEIKNVGAKLGDAAERAEASIIERIERSESGPPPPPPPPPKIPLPPPIRPQIRRGR